MLPLRSSLPCRSLRSGLVSPNEAVDLDSDGGDALSTFRQFFALQGDVLVLPVATFAFNLGRWVGLYASSPTLAFGVATVVGLVGTGYFLVFGGEFAAYA